MVFEKTLGTIADKFMEVPAEVLRYSMRTNQKYFTLQDKNGKMAPKFIFVSNLEAEDVGKAITICHLAELK